MEVGDSSRMQKVPTSDSGTTSTTKQSSADANGAEVEMTLAFGAERHIPGIPMNGLNLQLNCYAQHSDHSHLRRLQHSTHLCCKRAVCGVGQHLLWVGLPTVTNRGRRGRVPINDRWAPGWKVRHGQPLMKRQVRGINQVFSRKQKEGSTKSTESPIIVPAGPPFTQCRGHHALLKQFKGTTMIFAIHNEWNLSIPKNFCQHGLL